MSFFGGVWERYIKCPKSTRFGFDRAVEGFKESIENLFAGVSSGHWGEQLFYGSEHRNLIMEAGAERRLMQISYHGAERVIEPYALSYKKAAGKPAREYFYAHDRTRGDQIKTFLNTDVVALEILDEKFEPRYDVELSKAGEKARKGYFGKPFGEARSKRPRKGSNKRFPAAQNFRGLRGYEPVYKVQCPYCQKTFRRKTQSLALNEHKSPDGYRCGGRQGYRVF